jgi:hypothetical protein
MESTVTQEYGGSPYLEISWEKNGGCQYLVQDLHDDLVTKIPHSRVTLELISVFQRYAGQALEK